ncbi:MAG: 16S rRNA (guanine(966)-N(2))-methyltransferase RsmD [Dehalococcoidia bacterium]|nr:16S rRNA (guanine(966)-N(2))-methyltransferase RsmD [Dehalococcoidia bacterium]
MRISGGYLKGRRINSPDIGPGIRPTTERVKLAIFSVIGQEFVKGKRVLDLFSCTGALGLEAISRGALSVVFVEKKYKNCKLIKSNVDTLGVTEKSEIKSEDCNKFLKLTKGGFGLVLMDPPFDIPNWDNLMDEVTKDGIINNSGILVAEHKSGVELKHQYNNAKRFSHKIYGDSEVSFYEVSND